MPKALYLVPSSLGGEVAPCVTKKVQEVLRCTKHIIAENTKCAKRFIHYAASDVDVDALDYYEINEHTNLDTITDCLDPLAAGESIALMSDAGAPAVADPGSAAVYLAHQRGYKVVPLAGASSIIMSLMASGLGGQSFAFNGYLPIKAGERAKRLRQAEARAWQEGQTQIFIETPYRVDSLIDTLLHTLREETKLCIAAELTTDNEVCRTMTVHEWKKSERSSPLKMGKVRAVFLIAR